MQSAEEGCKSSLLSNLSQHLFPTSSGKILSPIVQQRDGYSHPPLAAHSNRSLDHDVSLPTASLDYTHMQERRLEAQAIHVYKPMNKQEVRLAYRIINRTDPFLSTRHQKSYSFNKYGEKEAWKLAKDTFNYINKYGTLPYMFHGMIPNGPSNAPAGSSSNKSQFFVGLRSGIEKVCRRQEYPNRCTTLPPKSEHDIPYPLIQSDSSQQLYDPQSTTRNQLGLEDSNTCRRMMNGIPYVNHSPHFQQFTFPYHQEQLGAKLPLHPSSYCTTTHPTLIIENPLHNNNNNDHLKSDYYCRQPVNSEGPYDPYHGLIPTESTPLLLSPHNQTILPKLLGQGISHEDVDTENSIPFLRNDATMETQNLSIAPEKNKETSSDHLQVTSGKMIGNERDSNKYCCQQVGVYQFDVKEKSVGKTHSKTDSIHLRATHPVELSYLSESKKENLFDYALPFHKTCGETAEQQQHVDSINEDIKTNQIAQSIINGEGPKKASSVGDTEDDSHGSIDSPVGNLKKSAHPAIGMKASIHEARARVRRLTLVSIDATDSPLTGSAVKLSKSNRKRNSRSMDERKATTSGGPPSLHQEEGSAVYQETKKSKWSPPKKNGEKKNQMMRAAAAAPKALNENGSSEESNNSKTKPQQQQDNPYRRCYNNNNSQSKRRAHYSKLPPPPLWNVAINHQSDFDKYVSSFSNFCDNFLGVTIEESNDNNEVRWRSSRRALKGDKKTNSIDQQFCNWLMRSREVIRQPPPLTRAQTKLQSILEKDWKVDDDAQSITATKDYADDSSLHHQKTENQLKKGSKFFLANITQEDPYMNSIESKVKKELLRLSSTTLGKRDCWNHHQYSIDSEDDLHEEGYFIEASNQGNLNFTPVVPYPFNSEESVPMSIVIKYFDNHLFDKSELEAIPIHQTNDDMLLQKPQDEKTFQLSKCEFAEKKTTTIPSSDDQSVMTCKKGPSSDDSLMATRKIQNSFLALTSPDHDFITRLKSIDLLQFLQTETQTSHLEINEISIDDTTIADKENQPPPPPPPIIKSGVKVVNDEVRETTSSSILSSSIPNSDLQKSTTLLKAHHEGLHLDCKYLPAAESNKIACFDRNSTPATFRFRAHLRSAASEQFPLTPTTSSTTMMGPVFGSSQPPPPPAITTGTAAPQSSSLTQNNNSETSSPKSPHATAEGRWGGETFGPMIPRSKPIFAVMPLPLPIPTRNPVYDQPFSQQADHEDIEGRISVGGFCCCSSSTSFNQTTPFHITTSTTTPRRQASSHHPTDLNLPIALLDATRRLAFQPLPWPPSQPNAVTSSRFRRLHRKVASCRGQRRQQQSEIVDLSGEDDSTSSCQQPPSNSPSSPVHQCNSSSVPLCCKSPYCLVQDSLPSTKKSPTTRTKHSKRFRSSSHHTTTDSKRHKQHRPNNNDVHHGGRILQRINSENNTLVHHSKTTQMEVSPLETHLTSNPDMKCFSEDQSVDATTTTQQQRPITDDSSLCCFPADQASSLIITSHSRTTTTTYNTETINQADACQRKSSSSGGETIENGGCSVSSQRMMTPIGVVCTPDPHKAATYGSSSSSSSSQPIDIAPYHHSDYQSLLSSPMSLKSPNPSAEICFFATPTASVIRPLWNPSPASPFLK